MGTSERSRCRLLAPGNPLLHEPGPTVGGLRSARLSHLVENFRFKSSNDEVL